MMEGMPPEQEPSDGQKESDGSEWKKFKKLPSWIYIVIGILVVIFIGAGVYFLIK